MLNHIASWQICFLAFRVTLLCLITGGGVLSAKPPHDTQKPGEHPPAGDEIVAGMTLPAGFEVSLFAAEPHVRQPIAIDIDDRGRLWVAQCDTYEGGPYDRELEDRILILEDANVDGKFDRRREFWAGPGPLSGLTLGFGGVWALCAGELRFYPDRDGDDRPDGPPVVHLAGWDYLHTRHNVVNGLKWGPDGWLYGRHGISDISTVGRPETPAEKRTLVDCAIWRYHPARHQFEVVCRGTTNPWGFDYDDHGEMFFTNNVNGHLWHVLPGARYIRMYGEHPNPYLYELMGACADHDHWDTSAGDWAVSRGGKGKHGQLGGGHSHCGGMIYLGDNWPSEYRNSMLMCNTHGYRVNRDRLVLTEEGYRGRHAPDFLLTHSPWFRGVSLEYGPDGGVYLSDWTDYGECHDHDGVHRSSGRIYKITYGPPTQAGRAVNIGALTSEQLVMLQLHPNDWYVRHARRRLQELAIEGNLDPQTIERLHAIFREQPETTRKLRAMWALYSMGALDDAWLAKQLQHADPHVRAWSVRLLVDDRRVSPDVLEQILQSARSEQSTLVRLHLASALGRLPLSARLSLAVAILRPGVDSAKNRHLRLMVWYGIEPAVAANPREAISVLQRLDSSRLRRFASRRISETWPGRGDIDAESLVVVSQLVRYAADSSDRSLCVDVLSGVQAALRGRLDLRTPRGWNDIRVSLDRSDARELRELARQLDCMFGGRRDGKQLAAIVLDTNVASEHRRAALQTLLQVDQQAAATVLPRIAAEQVMAAAAVEALQRVVDVRLFTKMAGRYPWLKREAREALIETAVTRPPYALVLLRQVSSGKMPREDITAYHARQLRLLRSEEVDQVLEEVWGRLGESDEEKTRKIELWRRKLTADRTQSANLAEGRKLFAKTCGKCHRLFGEGDSIGPDLTGGNRKNLDYVLENVITPSALVPRGTEVHVVLMEDGRVLSGMVVRQTPQVIELQMAEQKVTLDRSAIDQLKATGQSLMPEGQLDTMTEQQVVDLMAYIMSDGHHE